MSTVRQVGFLATWLVALATGSIRAGMLLPPATSTTDLSLWLTQPAENDDSWSARALLEAAGDSNVLPLLEVDDDPLPPRLHTQSGSRFVGRFLDLRELRYKQWRLTRGWGTVQYFHGTSDAGQLWLDLESNTSRPGKHYEVGLTAEETKLSWWGLGRDFTVHAGGSGGVSGRIDVRWLNVFRHRRGQLDGWFENDDFNGNLTLFSSRGIGFASAGHGYAVDVDLKAAVTPHWSVAVRCEGALGRIHWNRYRRLDAAVTSANVFQDPQGFIHNLPSATGTERQFPLSRTPLRAWETAVAWRQGKGQWVLGYRSAGPPATYRLSRVQPLSRHSYLLGSWDLNRGALGLSYCCPTLTITVRSSHSSLSDAFVGDVALELRGL